MGRRHLLIGIAFGLVPQLTFAAVSINEIAWMGTTESANDEWIELYNDSASTIAVDGWAITDGQALNIELTGAIAGGAYAVLERTDDNAAPGTAFLIYTGALTNSGATLILRDQNGAVVDQVFGGEDWESVGGDNTTKETAQYTTLGWVTALATPGVANTTIGVPKETKTEEPESDDEGSTSRATTPSKKKGSSLIPSTRTLSLDIDLPEVVYVNQPITFTGVPSTIGETIVESLVYDWNFGDLTTQTGKTVAHTYQYPGEYMVSLRAHYARHDTMITRSITVLPVRFSITQNETGDLQIHNDAPYDVDVSGYRLGGEEMVTFPKHSFIAKGATVTVPGRAFNGRDNGVVRLYDRSGTVVASHNSNEVMVVIAVEVSEPVVRQPIVTATLPAPPIPTEQFNFKEPKLEPEPSLVSQASNTTLAASPIAAVHAAAANPSPVSGPLNNLWPLFGLLGIIALGLTSVYLGTHKI